MSYILNMFKIPTSKSGWWFGTCFYDFPLLFGSSSSQLTSTPWFFRGLGIPPTRNIFLVLLKIHEHPCSKSFGELTKKQHQKKTSDPGMGGSAETATSHSAGGQSQGTEESNVARGGGVVGDMVRWWAWFSLLKLKKTCEPSGDWLRWWKLAEFGQNVDEIDGCGDEIWIIRSPWPGELLYSMHFWPILAIDVHHMYEAAKDQAAAGDQGARNLTAIWWDFGPERDSQKKADDDD